MYFDVSVMHGGNYNTNQLEIDKGNSISYREAFRRHADVIVKRWNVINLYSGLDDNGAEIHLQCISILLNIIICKPGARLVS